MKPIAMRCTQSDWDNIKPILEEKLNIKLNLTFVYNYYLINNFVDTPLRFMFVTNIEKVNYNRTVYEEWDKNIFLEACGIKVKPEFIVGKWYKSSVGANQYYVKFKSLTDKDSFGMYKIVGETIEVIGSYGHRYEKNNYYYVNDASIKQVLSNGLLKDLKEIQEYLPDGHVDKIVDFTLPEKWCVKSNEDTIKIIAAFWDKSLFLDKVYTDKDNIRHFQEFYFYSHNLASGEPFGQNGGSNHVSKTIRGDSKEITFEQFKNYVLKEENMNNRFPFTLSAHNAQKIINAACTQWKTKLAAQWGYNIALNITALVTEEEYRTMRKACTAEQNILFDSIFGKDNEKCPYKHGELIWVKSSDTTPWQLRYSTGELNNVNQVITYASQKILDGPITIWEDHRPAPGIKLPV